MSETNHAAAAAQALGRPLEALMAPARTQVLISANISIALAVFLLLFAANNIVRFYAVDAQLQLAIIIALPALFGMALAGMITARPLFVLAVQRAVWALLYGLIALPVGGVVFLVFAGSGNASGVSAAIGTFGLLGFAITGLVALVLSLNSIHRDALPIVRAGAPTPANPLFDAAIVHTPGLIAFLLGMTVLLIGVLPGFVALILPAWAVALAFHGLWLRALVDGAAAIAAAQASATRRAAEPSGAKIRKAK
jgi:hypothetical protein